MGRISSIETMGLVDGPGIRFVVFMQGCKNRCIFCHNPETWNINNGTEITPKELIDKIIKYRNYYGNDGGVTFSGGEPLIQDKFLLECLKLCHKNNINTCLDTSGVGNGKYDIILKYVDLVLYDIKALDNDNYKYIVKNDINESLVFLDTCQKLHKKLWIRQVIIPGINDTIDYISLLANYIRKIKNVEKVELLPYHNMAISKYKDLNINYPLLNTPNMDKDRCKELEKLLLEKIGNE